MKQNTTIFGIIIAWLLFILPVSAATANSTIVTTIIDTPYLDYSIWLLILLLGLGFLILSNIAQPNQGSALWALIAPFFLWSAAYFSLMIQTMSYVPTIGTDGLVYITIQQTVYHPEWLALVLGIISILSTINVFYILTKKAIQKPTRAELETTTDTDY